VGSESKCERGLGTERGVFLVGRVVLGSFCLESPGKSLHRSRTKTHIPKEGKMLRRQGEAQEWAEEGTTCASLGLSPTRLQVTCRKISALAFSCSKELQ
jgi:hypothetical protein